MFRKLSFLLLVTMLALVALSGCGGSSAPNVDWTLEITGPGVGDPQSLSYKQLAAMPQTTLEDVVMEKSQGEDQVNSWSGVALQDLLEKASVNTYDTITAVAADGYAIDIPADELDNAIVALQRDGEWITDAEPDKGPIRLVAPQTPGNRWVFQLTELQVN